jgi:hypothetical protein
MKKNLPQLIEELSQSTGLSTNTICNRALDNTKYYELAVARNAKNFARIQEWHEAFLNETSKKNSNST